MKSNENRFLRNTKGQSLVEFALILPMMLVVMFMITEFGRALYMFNVLSAASREGARHAVVSSAGSAVSTGTAAMQKLLADANMSTGATLSVVIDDNYQGTGQKVVIATATKPFNWAFTGPMHVNPGQPTTVSPTALTLKGESIMKAETF